MRQQLGFTLLELMIVIVILGILLAIAVPNYNDYLTKGRITEAVTALSNMQTRMEQHFLDARDYSTACTAASQAPQPADTQYFTFSCANLTATTFRVDATGTGRMAGFQYRITQQEKSTVALPSGWAGTGAKCFVLNKSGGC